MGGAGRHVASCRKRHPCMKCKERHKLKNYQAHLSAGVATPEIATDLQNGNLNVFPCTLPAVRSAPRAPRHGGKLFREKSCLETP